MQRLRHVLAGLALSLAAVLPASPALAAAPAGATGYWFQEGYACATQCAAVIFVDLHTTNSQTQIWINGHVGCFPDNGIRYSWCGYVGSTNGTGMLDTGVNFTWGGNSYWFRFDIYAGGYCRERGNAFVIASTYCFGAG